MMFFNSWGIWPVKNPSCLWEFWLITNPFILSLYQLILKPHNSWWLVIMFCNWKSRRWDLWWGGQHKDIRNQRLRFLYKDVRELFLDDSYIKDLVVFWLRRFYLKNIMLCISWWKTAFNWGSFISWTI